MFHLAKGYRMLVGCGLLAMVAPPATAAEPKTLDTLDAEIADSPDDPQSYVSRAKRHSSAGRHPEAIADLDRAIKLDPDAGQVIDFRGSERLLAGQFDEAISDFDRFLAKHPDQAPYHWKRGIALYYAGRYDDGVKQFDLHQTVNRADVENAVWRYLCMARRDGVEAARRALLKVGPDARVPMAQIYDLYAGKTATDVFAAARAGEPSAAELRVRLFYAHLYIALDLDARGDSPKAIEHLKLAVDKNLVEHYMGGIAQVHLAVLEKQAERGKQ